MELYTRPSETERALLDIIQKGRALEQIKAMEGWEILSDTLDQQRNQAVELLVSVIPGSNEEILAAHAVAHAVSETITNLRNAVDRAIEAGREAPKQLEELNAVKILEQQKFEF